MAVRITGGALRGRVVPVADLPGLRPTAARTREALFSMLGQDLDGRTVLDPFGGSGVLTFEAMSRGAGPATIVERSRRAASAISASAAALGLTVQVRVSDARRALKAGDATWDLVLMDPPYADDPVTWLELAAPRVGWRVCLEYRFGATLPLQVGGLQQLKQRRYGDSSLAVYGPGEPA